MFTEFADVSRTRRRSVGVAERLRSAAGSRRSCRRRRTRARSPPPPLNIVNCASCVGLTRPSGYRTTTRVCGTPWKACATALPVSPDVAARTVSGSSPRVERRHQPRHHARADVLERERRAVKQLEREDARLDLDERESESSAPRRRPPRSVVASSSPRVYGRSARRPISVSVRRGRRASSSGGPRLDRLGHVEAAVGREPLEQRVSERDAGRRACRASLRSA